VTRYRLDDLGWYQFEWLVQSLLKAELGIGVESWGGRGDHGRDAFCATALNFPAKHITSEGPFVFQAKFVENANAAGAEFRRTVLHAVSGELERIRHRAGRIVWQPPNHYVLITNAPLQADLREEIAHVLRGVVPPTGVHSLGADDLCALLDAHKTLRRSFPQLLSLRDLDLFIKEAVNAEIYEKSRAAMDQARDFAPAFVPTSTYHKAWRILREHHFVVLEGPPEMGKTAIAWVIALAQLANGWQAIAADRPKDFFKSYDVSVGQVFVADDAFGRTEYNPTRGNEWEAELHRVYRQLDPRHWLVWTSRRHILERAIRVMDLQGEASTFPNPGAVLVDASQLSIEEKALILYRHARRVGLEPQARDLIRGRAVLIVQNPCFTPERIRRLVQDRLAEMVAIAKEHGPDSEVLASEVKEAIQNPTDRMRKSFRSLPTPHKWALVSLLEAGDTYLPSAERVGQLYESHCPLPERRPFNEVAGELSEAFVKTVSTQHPTATGMGWMHPSYRDLAIDELASDASLQAGFLESMSLEGIKLAVSSSGGSAGTRRFPLMTSAASWDLLEKRSVAIALQEGPWSISRLLETLTEATLQAGDTDSEERLRIVIAKVCDAARTRWDADAVELDHRQLSRFTRASELISPLPKLPDLTPSWNGVTETFKRILRESKKRGFVDDPDLLLDCVELWNAVKESEPRLLRQAAFPEGLETEFDDLLDLVEEDAKSEPIFDTADEYRAESQRLTSLCDAIRTLSGLTIEHSVRCDALIAELTHRSQRYDTRADELQPEEPEPEYGMERSPSESFSIDALFSDL
jgi:hypothetical protein